MVRSEGDGTIASWKGTVRLLVGRGRFNCKMEEGDGSTIAIGFILPTLTIG